MKVFSVGSAPMESSVSIIPNPPQSRVPEVCDITASTSYRTNRLTVTKIVTGLFIRFAPFCSFLQQKAKMPQNRDSEAKKAKKMVHPTRFELMTFYSGGRRSIQLSYGCPCPLLHNIFLFYRNKSPQTQKSSKFFLQSNLGPPPFFRKQYTTTKLSRNVPIPKKSKKSRKIIANIFFQNILYFELSGRMWFFGKVFLTWKSVIQEAVTFPFNYPVFIPFFR